MSRQNKNAKRRTLAKEITKLHLSGQRATSTTEAKHGKAAANRHYTSKTRGLKDMDKSKKRNKFQ